MIPGCDFDENFYAYYSDLEQENIESNNFHLYIGSNMSGKNKHGKLFVISGPSGVGKTTLANSLLARLGRSHNISRVITYTTKSPRAGEQAGVDYHYLTITEFEAKLASGFFIEYSQAYGNYYGSPKSLINDLKDGRSFILVVDQVGAYHIKQQYPGAVLIWITPPSLAELTTRLARRSTESSVDMYRRLELAQQEIANEEKNRLFDYVIENNILHETIVKLESVLKSEISSESINS